MGIALAKDRMLSVELWHRVFRDEELRSIRTAARWAGTGIGHSQTAWYIECERWVDLVLEKVAGIAGSVANSITALNHKTRNNPMERSSVVVRLLVDLLERLVVRPVFCPLGKADKIRRCYGSLLIVELAGKSPHSRIDNSSRPCRNNRCLGLACGARCIGQCICRRWRR